MKRFVIAIFLLITFSLACKTLLPTESPAEPLLTSEVITPSLTTENIVPYARAPFITSLIHENNFYRSGPVGWSSIYYSVEQNKRKLPVSPPYDLNAPDPSHLRSEKDREAIWQAYEALVAYAAQNLNVVTSQDILMMAANSR